MTPSFETATAVVTISSLCSATGASSRAIRHYEDVGLLSPLRSRGGGRLYTAHQCAIAALIVSLRNLDVPIADLPPLIDLERPEAERLHDVRRALERRETDLSAQLEAVRSALATGGDWGRVRPARR